MADLSIILYDASLQSAAEFPEKFLRHKAIQNDAAREGCPAEQLIVDVARHYPAIRELEPSTRLKIGRPDLVHVSLLTLLHHPLMTANPHQAYIHTIGENWFRVPSDWRIPVNYIRFMGLMRQLFVSKRVPDSKKPILELNKGNLGELIEKEGLSGRKILLSAT
jgi:rRNA small subunit pseudouridine methyltransferase Nep1